MNSFIPVWIVNSFHYLYDKKLKKSVYLGENLALSSALPSRIIPTKSGICSSISMIAIRADLLESWTNHESHAHFAIILTAIIHLGTFSKPDA